MNHHSIPCFARVVSSRSIFLRVSALIACLLIFIGMWSCVNEDRKGVLLLEPPPPLYVQNVQTGPPVNPNPSVVSYLTGYDEHLCQIATVISSIDSSDTSGGISRPTLAPQIHRVRFGGGNAFAPRVPQSNVRLVSDPLSPDTIREAQEQGITHADQQFEKAELEKISKGSRTQAQTDRINELDKMIQDYKEGQAALRTAAKEHSFVDLRSADITEQTAQARRLQHQAEAICASGTPGSDQVAKGLEATAQALMGGQPLPPLPDGTKSAAGGRTDMTRGQIEGEVVDQSWRPIHGVTAGAIIFGPEDQKSLNDPKVDQ